MSKINIHYFLHSGFSVETTDCILIFDFYKEVLCNNENSTNLKQLLLKGKPAYVFVSHSHPDHFNKKILTLEDSNIKYIISDDIKLKESKSNYTFVKKNDVFTLDNLAIKVFGSTDAGVSFLVSVDDFNIFHAGDLNWWHWKEDSDEDNLNAEKWFKEEISLIKGEKIDLAFFPVDTRLEENFYLGGKYFIENVHVKYFIPMHIGNSSVAKVIEAFKNEIQSSDVILIDASEKDIEL
ncbi:metal-dependent hydrolase [Clostridium homopropionicum DSM 5847]|uniref:Metal-dependent hydrolase n=1 Tax=Clostridium homopropionicum DSM 5847 TaxID=1121318 RepID=A0A0L6Z6N9_9CLOT|nr:MBL fold metallo-hydrolase [Clostridium homopropionicum]KOA18632.1 metal-dependent hydrolase [Clostridium homopropionicum DSM 5847]SFG50727.1 L-ascorbate metabolism protein UlaG, beta-lactamase superfamily [Clostridium homopropionicum]